MQEISQDLIRLCTLMHMKNEIQGRRHHARKRALRIDYVLNHKTLIQKVKRYQKIAAWNIEDEVEKYEKKHSPIFRRSMATNRADFTQQKANAVAWLAHNGKVYRGKSISNKMLKMSHRDLKIAWYEAHIADLQACHDLRVFTKTYGVEMRMIMNRNGWFADMDNSNGRYDSVVMRGADRLIDSTYLVKGRQAIANVAATQLLEEAMTQ